VELKGLREGRKLKIVEHCVDKRAENVPKGWASERSPAIPSDSRDGDRLRPGRTT
jgi:hypothetical protein